MLGRMIFYENIFSIKKCLTTLVFSAILYPWFAKSIIKEGAL